MKKLQTILDKSSTLVAAILCGVMMAILLANVILRYIPGIGGFKWYMEGGQYLNVFSMLLAGIGITVQRTHLHVELVDTLVENNPGLKKIHTVIVSVFIILFYALMTYSGWMLCTKAKQAVSTMPQFTMGQVYTIFPIAGALCVLAGIVDLIVQLTEKKEEENK
ncbi:MAG: TRAP transporter small permease subunit [Lachnospiraceae bacterium]|nr:TRAP transporter small permease subunit [Lachnospiraceae bacterium]